MNLKVGVMPGKLVEVAVEKGESARNIFELAGVEVSNHEIRLDGNKIDIDSCVNNGRLLVAMKMIKGNMPSIKVGVMPGRLTVVEYNRGESAKNLFEKANVEVSNHEIRLDGNKIDINDEINEGNLLVAMKMIKGNAKVFSSDCTEDEISILLEEALPQVIKAEDVVVHNGVVEIKIGNSEVIIDEDMFRSIYDETEADLTPAEERVHESIDWNDDNIFTPNFSPIVENSHVCTCSNAKSEKAIEVLEELIEENRKEFNYYMDKAMEYKGKIDVLETALNRIK